MQQRPHPSCWKEISMRRDEKEIADRGEIDRIIRRAVVCRLAFESQGEPYLVPVCFGYDGNSLYFHCAPEGRKLDMLAPGARVCFELEADVGVITADSACGWTMAYSSVIGWGSAAIVENQAGRKAAMNTIMNQYGGPDGPYADRALGRTAVVRIEIEQISGKCSQPRKHANRTETER
jgi:uncharacterized protein